jgi:hypothetical protein
MSNRSGATFEAGHIRAVSIGYQVHRFEVSKPEAASASFGARWTGRPFEVSAVPVGADPSRRLPRPIEPFTTASFTAGTSHPPSDRNIPDDRQTERPRPQTAKDQPSDTLAAPKDTSMTEPTRLPRLSRQADPRR